MAEQGADIKTLGRHGGDVTKINPPLSWVCFSDIVLKEIEVVH